MNNSENLPTDNNNKSIVKGKTMYNWETHDNQDKVIVDSIKKSICRITDRTWS